MRTHFSREEQSYFRKRIVEIKEEKILDIRNQYTHRWLSCDEKLQLIASEQIPFNVPSLSELGRHPYMQYLSCYDFSEYETPICTDELSEKRQKDVEIEARALADCLMTNEESYRPTFLRKLGEFERRIF
jgi:hypothetical protein